MISKSYLRRLILAAMTSGLLWSSGASGQTQSINTPSLTAVLPPAPNAFELTKYSGLPISLSSGSASASIPIGEVSHGAVSVPVGLMYNSGNGIKVNQIASRAGMGWAMNSGGVISRTVFGKPDESTHWLTPPAGLNSGSVNTENYNYLDSASRDLYDTQADIFSFDFNGYSGKFYLKPSQKSKVIQLSASPLKIETNFNNEFSADWSIRITDPSGTKYYFGGTGATEKSKTVPIGSTCGKVYDSFIPTAWYLKSISGIHGEYIWFTYTPCTFDYLADVSETLIRTPSGTLSTAACPGGNCPSRNESQVCASNLRSEGVILKSINSRFTKAVFLYGGRTDIAGDSLTTAINFYKKGITDTTALTLYDNYTLAYVNSNNTSYYNPQYNITSLAQRPFLQQVIRKPAAANPQIHNLNYYNMNGLASRLAFAQDYWGYFNGKNNQHLVPTSTEPNESALFSTLADRNPDAAYAYMGLLSSISYPTGGKDSLEYEANTVFETRNANVPRTSVSQFTTGTGTSTGVSYTTSFTLSQAQNVPFDLSCQYSGTGVNDQIHQHSILQLRNESNNVIYTQQLAIGQSYSTVQTLSAGTYTVVWTSYGAAAQGSINFSYQSQGAGIAQNYQAGGVRVLRNISIPNTGATLRKRLVYAGLGSQALSSGVLRELPDSRRYYADLVDGKPCNDGSVAQCSYKIAYSNPVNPLYYSSGGHIYYTDVIELKDESWANGGTAHHYIGGKGSNPLLVRGRAMQGVPLSNYGFATGLEDQTKDFLVNGSGVNGYIYKIVKETKKHYVADTRLLQELDNYVVKKSWQNPQVYSTPNEYSFAPFDVEMFAHVATWTYADSTSTTQYDTEGNNPYQNHTIEVYNNTTHLQPNEIWTNRSDGKSGKTEFKYAQEMLAETGAAAYQSLINANRITIPVVKTAYVNSSLTQQLTTDYENWSAGVTEPVSAKLKVGSGNANELISYNAYAVDGKLLTQSQTGGMKISYKYGYRNLLPVAECKNANVDEFYFENFEENLGAAGGHTGIRSYAGDFQVNWSPPNGRTYLVAYFYLESGKWKYKVQDYSTGILLSDGDAIDDVAVYPKDALFKSSAYDVVEGLSSTIDEKGETSFYEYDEFRRLLNIKDQNANILKNFSYHLVNPLASNTYYNATVTQSFSKSCSSGTGSSVLYTVNAGSYSSTISQADADNQAQADIAANGQANADTQGSCLTGNASVSYTNDTNINTNSQRSGGVTTLNVKNSAGAVVYSFSESQLGAGITLAPGTYTFELITYGAVYSNSAPNYGWGVIQLLNPAFSGIGKVFNTNGVNTFIMSNLNLAGGSYQLSVQRFDSID